MVLSWVRLIGGHSFAVQQEAVDGLAVSARVVPRTRYITKSGLFETGQGLSAPVDGGGIGGDQCKRRRRHTLDVCVPGQRAAGVLWQLVGERLDDPDRRCR